MTETAQDDGLPPVDRHLDLKGLLCPLPVLKTRRALKELPSGARLSLDTTDPVAAIDIPHFCRQDGHELVAQRRGDHGVLNFVIRKA